VVLVLRRNPGQIVFLCLLAVLLAAEAGAGVLYLEIGNEDPGILEGVGKALYGNGDYPSDGHLTMAGRLEYGLEKPPDFAESLLKKIPFLGTSGIQNSYFLAQGAYTPAGDNKSSPTVVPDDRPYAGYLKLGCRLAAVTPSVDRQTVDTLDITTGIIGPASLASKVQEEAHSAIGSDSVSGWDNQLANEPIINIELQRQFRFLQPVTTGFMLELSPHLTGALGNMFTYAGAGLMARAGSGLDRDYGAPVQGLQLSGLRFHKPARTWRWNVFAGLEARTVLRNIFLDGNTFRSSHSVDKETFVVDYVVGAAIIYKSIQATVSLLDRSEEFKLQQGHDSLVKFALSLGW
jgi:lipid A 3-O-deacylase